MIEYNNLKFENKQALLLYKDISETKIINMKFTKNIVTQADMDKYIVLLRKSYHIRFVPSYSYPKWV